MKDNYHVLDYKFDNDKLVDIQKDHEYIQLSMATTFVRAEALKDDNLILESVMERTVF